MKVIGFRAYVRCGSTYLECLMALLDESVATIRYCLN